MNRRILKFAALLAALCLALTGCNLIGVDPLMQLAEDRAAVDDIRETVLAEYDGGTVTVSDIIYDFNLQWSYYYQLYSMYGMELDGDTLRSLRNDCVDMAVQRAAQAVEAGRRASPSATRRWRNVRRGRRKLTITPMKAYCPS